MSIYRLQRPRLVVDSNGTAGMRTVEELLARAPDRFDIMVTGGEPHPRSARTLAEMVIQPSS